MATAKNHIGFKLMMPSSINIDTPRKKAVISLMSVFFPKSLNDWKSKPKDDDASIGSKTQVTVDELNKINGMNAKNLTTNALVTGLFIIL